MKKVLSLLMCVVMVISLVVSASALSIVKVKSIKVDNSDITLDVGKTYNLKVVFTPANTTQKFLQYVTSNKNIATIDAKGKITAVKAGNVIITVTSTINKTVMAQCIVTVPKIIKQVKKAKIALEFQAHWGSTTRRPIVEKMVSDFNASQDDVRVKYVFVPWGDIWTKNTAAIAAGKPCDVIINNITDVRLRASKNQMVDLSTYMAKEKEKISDRFYQNLYNVCVYNNTTYGLPFNTDTRLIFYNKDDFKEVGLDPETPPKTWADLEKFADKLDKKDPATGKYIRMGFYPLFGGVGNDVWCLNADKGLSWFDYANGDKVTIDTPAKLDALNWVKKWKDRYGSKNIDNFKAEFGSKERTAFLAGKVSIYPEVATYYTQIRDFNNKKINWGVAPIPERTVGSGNWSWGGGFDIEIPRGAKHPDASWEFLKYMTDFDAQKYWAQYNFDIVANKSANNDPDLLKEPAFKAAADNMKSTVFTVLPLSAPDNNNLINPQLDAFMLDKIDAKTALKNAQRDVENLQKQYKK
jgi:multiple sugar transport system substrate-binding protein